MYLPLYLAISIGFQSIFSVDQRAELLPHVASSSVAAAALEIQLTCLQLGEKLETHTSRWSFSFPRFSQFSSLSPPEQLLLSLPQACGQYICPSIFHTQQQLQRQRQQQQRQQQLLLAAQEQWKRISGSLSEAASEPEDKQTRTRPKGWQKVLPTTQHASMGCSSCCNSCCPMLLLCCCHGNGTLPFRSFSCIQFDRADSSSGVENILLRASPPAALNRGHWHWLN